MAESKIITPRKNNTLKIWAIVLLVGPTALWVLAFAFFAIGNYAFGSLDMQSSGEFRNTGPVQVFFNVTGFLMGALAFLTWLPGLIIGIILLATGKKSSQQ